MCHKSVPPSLKRRVSGRIAPCVAVLALAWGGATGALFAQNGNEPAQGSNAPGQDNNVVAQDSNAPAPLQRGGLRIVAVSGYAVYYSSFLPNGGASPQPGSTNLPSDMGGGGSIVFDCTRLTEQSTFSLHYTPSYTGYVRNSSLNALNHALSLNTSRKLNPGWTFGFTAAGNLSSLEESLFTPTTLSNVASVPSTFNDLSAAILSANFDNNPQLGAALTSSPLVESPVRNLLYGQRMFMSSAGVSLSYLYSPRVSVTFSGGGSHTQHISQGQAMAASNTALIADTTSGNASVAVSYSLSRVTQLGATVTAARTASPLQDTFITTSQASLGRTLGMRWFMQVHGGLGASKPVRQTSLAVSMTPAPVAGGSLGFKTLSQTFLGSYDRVVSDQYGLGASTSSSATATWRWRRPSRAWWLESSFSWQWLQGNTLVNTSGWHATVGLNRAMGAHIVFLTQYTYLDYSGGLLAATSHLSQSAVRVSAAWTPYPSVPQ